MQLLGLDKYNGWAKKYGWINNISRCSVRQWWLRHIRLYIWKWHQACVHGAAHTRLPVQTQIMCIAVLPTRIHLHGCTWMYMEANIRYANWGMEPGQRDENNRFVQRFWLCTESWKSAVRWAGGENTRGSTNRCLVSLWCEFIDLISGIMTGSYNHHIYIISRTDMCYTTMNPLIHTAIAFCYVKITIRIP